ncbi:MAG: GIY-YIG nuclease family protein [Pseudodonghicola sp.]|nr:GIY-YIG nuclease family protein [Pseudodonghicola sp.]
MNRDRKKALIAAYKERKRAVGIYAVLCEATGACWVGATPNLDTVENRLWFTLRHGSTPHASLQSAWAAQGAAAFRFEVLEQFKDDLSPLALDRQKKERLAHWVAARQATAL